MSSVLGKNRLSLLKASCSALPCLKQEALLEETYRDYIQNAYLSIQSLSFKCRNAYPTDGDLSMKDKEPFEVDKLAEWALECIQLTIDSCYNFFRDSYGSRMEFLKPIRFEVTFMTLSYKDKEITIPCSQNHEHIIPPSMLLREKERDIYRNTITAKVYDDYSMVKPLAIRIISDTSSNYEFIYEGQERNAKSSIVVPVRSKRSELLGTLVVVCNSVNFFKESDREFWEEMMRFFTTEIGIYKLILDSCAHAKDVEALF